MCGRYSISKSETEVAKRFGVKIESNLFAVRYNAAPSQILPVITNEDPSKIVFQRWGLIPSWAKDSSIGNKLINARAETIGEKPAFRKAIRSQRCLVIADGFYEWKKTPRGKAPYRITMKNGEIFAFAGVWDRWKDEHGNEIKSFSIITVEPNALMVEIHNRMPAILLPGHEKGWLENLSLLEALEMLKPFPAELMECYPVSKLVNSPANDVPEVIQPLGDQIGKYRK